MDVELSEAARVAAERDRRRVIGLGGQGAETDWAALRASWRMPEVMRGPHLNIADLCCDSWAVLVPDRVAIRDLTAGRTWTYGQLKDASDRLAASFRARGVERGDRVGVFLPQGAAVMITHFAVMKLGAVVLPLFTLFGPDALAHRLADSGAKVAVTDSENFNKVNDLRDDLADLREVYLLDGAVGDLRDFWAEIAAFPPGLQPELTGPKDPAVMIYTSGTTGSAKGALHAHRFLLGHLSSMEITHEGFPQDGDVGWTPADWAWIGGLMDMAVPCLYYGVPLIALRMRKFDANDAYAMIRDQGVRTAFLPPTALKMMRGTPVPDGVRLRSVSSGGESLGAGLLDWGRQVLGCPINEIYGQTECNLVISQAAGAMAVRPGMMGKALPGHDVAVIDAAGIPVAAGTLGEIAVHRSSPSMFLGYWRQPDKTAAKFAGDWLRTGDLGTCDDQGYFTYVARDDDLISSAGYRIGPAEIEDCLMGDADVVNAAVIGVPDPVRGEVVKGFVILREGAAWDNDAEARLIDRVRARVSPHLAPRSVERVEALPMTATGKVIRRDLRARG